MEEIIRSVLQCAVVCAGILITVQLLRGLGALSFLPENDTGKAVAVLGTAVFQEDWKNGLVSVFAQYAK